MELSPAVHVGAPERGVLRVVLDRPATGNGITAESVEGLHRALDAAEAGPDVRVVLIESSSPQVFCAGMDLVAAHDGAGSEPVDHLEGGRRFFGLLARLTTSPRLIACHVEGRANGGGVGLVAACDLVFAGEGASFALPEALWGLVPACILPFLIRRVGFQPAHRLTLTTLPIECAEAHRVGLVDEVVTGLDVALRTLARRLQRIDPLTIGEAKRYTASLWQAGAAQQEQAVTEFARLMSAPLVRERIASFVEGSVVGSR